MSYQKIIETLVFAPSPDNPNDTHITITEGDFKDTVFKFGRTWFPNENEPILSFEYDWVGGPQPEKTNKAFQTLLGNILQHLLIKAVESQGITYTGGRDEVEVIEGDGSDYEPIFTPPPIIQATKSPSKIMLPEDYKVPSPEPGTMMSRNLLAGL